jgi:hypothetical protein
LFIFGLFVFTGALVGATYALYRGGENQLILSRDTAARQLRAYVSVEIVNNPSLDAAFIEARFVAKNRGQTPAYNVTQWVGADVVVLPASENQFSPPASIEGSSRRHLAPDAEVSIHSRIDISIPDEHKQLIRSGVMRIFMWGRVDYVDAFGVPRHTSFRVMYGDPGSVRTGTVTWCENGNDAD